VVAKGAHDLQQRQQQQQRRGQLDETVRPVQQQQTQLDVETAAATDDQPPAGPLADIEEAPALSLATAQVLWKLSAPPLTVDDLPEHEAARALPKCG
jgi:hypothetical protein